MLLPNRTRQTSTTCVGNKLTRLTHSSVCWLGRFRSVVSDVRLRVCQVGSLSSLSSTLSIPLCSRVLSAHASEKIAQLYDRHCYREFHHSSLLQHEIIGLASARSSTHRQLTFLRYRDQLNFSRLRLLDGSIRAKASKRNLSGAISLLSQRALSVFSESSARGSFRVLPVRQLCPHGSQ